jgi:Holliday junction DNA helicase RuvA
VAEALVGLGYSAKQADDAVSRAAEAAPADADVSAMLRAALRELGR